MPVNSVSFPTPQAYSGGADFSPLANLPNIYQQSQQRAAQQQALGQLGNDPTANAQALISSNDPTLAQLGIRMQQQQAQDVESRREFEAQQRIREQTAAQAKATFEEDSPTARAQKLVDQGIDPKDPAWRPWIITGQGAPDPNKVSKADQVVAETLGNYKAGKALGMTDDQAKAYAANKGKLPKEDLTATEERAATDADNRVLAAQDVIANIKQMREVSPKAWSGFESHLSGPAQSFLPSALVPQGAVETEKLKNLALMNVASQAKATFGARLNMKEVELLNKIETTPDMDDKARQAIYDQVETMMNRHLTQAQQQATGIRNKTYFKPGGNVLPPEPATQQVTPATPATTAKPTLSEFMTKARERNPGYTDSEIANEWKRRYGS